MQKKRTNDYSLTEAIDKTFASMNIAGKMSQAELKNNWERWMGKTIAKYTKDVLLHGSTLRIYIEGGPLKSELNYSKDKIIALVNEHFGKPIVSKVEIY